MNVNPIARGRQRTTGRHRLVVTLRVLAATLGGYYLAHGMTAFLTLALPFGKVDRVIAASLLSFAVWCAAAVYAIGARSLWRVWGLLIGGGTLLLATAMLLPELAQRA